MEDNKKTCPKCGNKMEMDSVFCSNCGERFSGNAATQKEKDYLDANSGEKLDVSKYDNSYFVLSENALIGKAVNESIEKIPNGKKLVLVPNEIRKIILTLIFVLLFFLIITIYVSYHIGFMIFLLLVVTVTYIMILNSYSIKKYLVKQASARPDEKIDYVVSSACSSAVNGKFKYVGIRVIILLILFVSVLCLYKNPHIIYEKQDNGYVVRYYTYGFFKKDEILEIPGEYKGKQVIGIRGDVFKNVKSLRVVKLPNSINEIRGGAFLNCTNLEDINLPPSITEIHGSTFENCYRLKSINIPSGVTRIGGSAFRNCTNLTYVTIPKSVKEIGSSAFRATSISSVCISRDALVNERAFKETYPTITYYENNCR